MIRLFMHLWRSRSRPPLGSTAWWKAWAKRAQQLPAVLKQGWSHARLRRHGAQVHPMTFFSDARLVSGRLELLSVGADSFIGRAGLSVHEKLSIGERVCINDGVKILTASHEVRDPLWRMVAKPVVIEDHVWIATNALILPGVTLRRGAVVGAGAVVTRDVPALGIVAGNPARLLKEPRVPELNYRPTESLALFRAWLST